MSLSNLFQGPGESLSDLLQRFNTAPTEASNPQDNIILMALIRGIHPYTDFGEWLSRKPPTTLYRFYNKAVQYLRTEEVTLIRRGNDTCHQDEAMRSNVAVRQSRASFENIAVNV